MLYEYVLKYQDFKDSQKLYLRHRRGAAVFYYLWVWILPIAGLLATIPFIYGLLGFRSDWMAPFAGFAAGGLWFALFIPLMQFYGKRRCWKQLIPANTPGKPMKIGIPVTLDFNDEQLISTIPGRSEGRFFWSAILDFAEDEKVALLFIQKKKFLFVPKTALPETGWAELRAHVQSKVKVS
jgi:hypothetical protein